MFLRSARALAWLAALGLVGVAAAQGGGSQSAAAPVEGRNVLVVDGRERGYELHLPAPSGAPSGASGGAEGSEVADVAGAPLVILLHGRGGTGAGMRDITAFDAVADAHGLVVAYPDGIAHEWNYT